MEYKVRPADGAGVAVEMRCLKVCVHIHEYSTVQCVLIKAKGLSPHVMTSIHFVSFQTPV